MDPWTPSAAVNTAVAYNPYQAVAAAAAPGANPYSNPYQGATLQRLQTLTGYTDTLDVSL